MNTIAATSRRVPRPAVVGIAVLTAAFAVLMVARSGILESSSSEPSAAPLAPSHSLPARPAKVTPAKARVVLLPGLPAQIAHHLRYSKVVVVSLYGTPADRSTAAVARVGARRAGAGFAALSLTNEATARALTSFAGSVSSPTVLVVRRPGTIVNRLPGSVDAVVVTQAAHNAGARR